MRVRAGGARGFTNYPDTKGKSYKGFKLGSDSTESYILKFLGAGSLFSNPVMVVRIKVM